MAGRAGRAYAFSHAEHFVNPPSPSGRICWSLLFRISIDAVIGDRISVRDVISDQPNTRVRIRVYAYMCL